MCLTPSYLISPKGLKVVTACRKCRLCRLNRVNDWVGRGIAEKSTAAACSYVTLTYGGDNKVTGGKTELGASILIYSDVQRFIRAYRDAGYPVRFMLSGEYGDLKGRSHWHLLLFWSVEAPPALAETEFYTDAFWCHGSDSRTPGQPYGFTYWVNDVTEKDIRYVAKYLLKPEQAGDTLFKMSKYPPIGDAYFRLRALTFAQQGLLPQDAFYSFPDILDRETGLPRQFWMSGTTLDNFLGEFIKAWEALYGVHPLDQAHSPFLLDWLDAQAQRTSSEQLERRRVGVYPSLPPPPGYRLAFQLWEERNVYFTEPSDGTCLPRLYWSFDDEGYPAWHESVRTATEAARIREFSRISKNADAYRSGREGRLYEIG